MANVSKQGVVTATSYANPNLLSRYASCGGNAPGVTGASAQTKYYGDYGIILPCAESKDTYFSLYLKEKLVNGSTYTISCMASGVVSGTYYSFPPFSQTSGLNQLRIDHNGLCCVTFTMSNANQPAATAGSETVYRCFLDDNGRSIASGQGPITLTHFKLEEGSIPTPWIPCNTDPIYEGKNSSMFEIDDICKIHKNGNIQAYQFIEI